MPAWKYKLAHLPESATANRHPVTAALLSLRGYEDAQSIDEFFAPDYERDLHSPFLFLQMERVVDRIRVARETRETVGIFGDFDADGVTSSVIIRDALTELGIATAVYIPDKNSEGHGLNNKAIDFFTEKNISLILTLDCGMTNHAEILYGKERGIATIVVDHHHVPPILPEAYAIINPKLKEETYPFRELCGAGTSFKVAQALYERLAPEKRDQLKWLLDVAATGTVADVMPLVGENRVLVTYGLIVLSRTRRIGFQEMFAVGRLQIDEEHVPDARTIGFQIAPRINAASRMAHAMLAHRLLVETDRAQARAFALELEKLNSDRQKICVSVTDMVRSEAVAKYSEKKFIFSADERYPFGIVGLIAGRIANEFRKPACIMTRGATTSQGSFRSVPELNIIETLEACSEYVVKFGGHAQAAGMTIENVHLEAFYEKFNALVEEKLENIATEPQIDIDFPVKSEHLTPELAKDLRRFAPFGEGNPEPVFSLANVTIDDVRGVGADGKHLKMKLSVPGSGKQFGAIGFSLNERVPGLRAGMSADIAFQLAENTWQGRTSLELKVLDVKTRK